MTTRTHRAVRKLAPFLNRIEPLTIFLVYLSVGTMAFFAWFFPPNASSNTGAYSLLIEAILLTVGFVLGLWGHTGRRPLIEFYGLCASAGGTFIFLCIVIGVVVNNSAYNYGQFVGIILLSLGLMVSHGFTLYHEITESWINAPSAVIQRIYEGK